MNYSVFKNKRIMITGHTGFIGSWLTKWLLMLNAEVLGYSLFLPSIPNLYSILSVSEKITDIRGDVRNGKHLQEVVADFQPEIVFHLAAQPIVIESYKMPLKTFQTNVMGTVNVLEALRKSETVRVIIVMTSDKVYKNKESKYSYREDDLLGGKDPYSASKSSQDIITGSYRESYFLDSGIAVSTARCGNVIGGGDWGKYRIIPDIVRGIAENRIVEIRNPDSVRPWQYILDLLSGILKLAENMGKNVSYSGDWNFGPKRNQGITVKALTEILMKYWEKGEYTLDVKQKEKEERFLGLNVSKSISRLGWVPKYSLDQSVKSTVDWYKSYLQNPKNVKVTTLKKIDEYVKSK